MRENDIPFVSLRNSGNSISFEDYELSGIKVRAAYDGAHKLLFVLDSTKDETLPNVLLVLNGVADRKWDDILENDFGIEPETIRPRINNKYQKLDVSYNGLDVYANAIFTRDASALKTWRGQVSITHQTVRKTEANHKISLSSATVNEAKKTIAELDEFIKMQKEKLRAAKKNIGKEPPKQSAEKILKFESRIEKAENKRARANRRLKRAEKRIETSEKILNNYPNAVGERIMNNENDVKPLFTQNPNIMDTENAFKPVSFSAVPDAPQSFIQNAGAEIRPATPITPRQVIPESPVINTPPIQQPSVTMPPSDSDRPVSPISGESIKIEAIAPVRQSGAYYLMLILLIGLSIFTLYLYQQKMGTNKMPHIQATTTQVTEQELAPIVTAAPTVAANPQLPVQDNVPMNTENPFINNIASAPQPNIQEPPVSNPQPMPEPEAVIQRAPVAVNAASIPAPQIAAQNQMISGQSKPEPVNDELIPSQQPNGLAVLSRPEPMEQEPAIEEPIIDDSAMMQEEDGTIDSEPFAADPEDSMPEPVYEDQTMQPQFDDGMAAQPQM